MANPSYEGLGPFQPPDQSAEIAQHAVDVQQASAAMALCDKIKVNSRARVAILDQTTLWLQVQRVPLDTNQMNALETARVTEETVQSDAFNYHGKVDGWVKYIQTLRSIESHHPGTITPERLVFPAMPAGLAAYAAANGLS